MQQSFHPGTTVTSVAPRTDKIASVLQSIAQLLFVVGAGLLPILFLPTQYLSVVYGKEIVFGAVLVLAILFSTLHVLRLGTVTLVSSPVLLAFWGVVGVTVLSAYLSGDLHDAFLGDALGIHTAAFTILLALCMTGALMLKNTKKAIVRLYGLLIISALILSVFHLVRLVVGADTVSFWFFNSAVDSPFGGWNDLALFFGLTLLLALLAIGQLPLTKIARVVLVSIVAIAMVMLAAINFTAVWIVLGLVSFITLIYSLVRHRISNTTDEEGSAVLVVLSVLIFLVSATFVIFGGQLTGAINSVTNINYVEVRPSASATLDIAKATYKDHALLGIGPNRFADAWRLYKDADINQTIFWNTRFTAGSSYVATRAIETGLLGLLAWIIFLVVFLWRGFRALFKDSYTDPFWRFVGTSSFVAALYLWGMSVVYVPGATTLLLAAICTGIFVAVTTQRPGVGRVVSLEGNKSVAFAFVAGAVVTIAVVVAAAYAVVVHANSIYNFNRAVATVEPGDALTDLIDSIASSYQLDQNDVFARQIAFYHLAQLNSLLTISEPSDAERQLFQNTITAGVNAAKVAVDADKTEPLNWDMLGQFYGLLSSIGVDGAVDRAIEVYQSAETLDPQNPAYRLAQARLAFLAGDNDQARSLAEGALTLRPRYAEAILTLAQIDIAEGKLDEAVSRARSLVALDPQNPAQYYQLAILLIEQGNREEAITALKQAIALEPQYANAHYVLGLQYVADGQVDAGIAELEIVRSLNENNTFIDALINDVKNGTPISNAGAQEVVTEPGEEASPEVITEEFVDSDLVSPVNSVPETDETVDGTQ